MLWENWDIFVPRHGLEASWRVALQGKESDVYILLKKDFATYFTIL